MLLIFSVTEANIVSGPAKGVTHSHETLRWMMASAIAAFGSAKVDDYKAGIDRLAFDGRAAQRASGSRR